MPTPAAKQRGFTYVGLLFAVVIIGLTLTVAAHVWQTTVKREREAELLWVGHAYRMAIASYFAFGHRYPATLQQLVTDERFPVPRHHLRRLYPDPVTGATDWTLILTPDQNGIQGVASHSQAVPIKRDGFDLVDAAFKGVKCYCAWEFVYLGNRWGAGLNLPGLGSPVPPPPTLGSQLPSGTTASPGVPLPPSNNNPPSSPPPSSLPSDPGPN